VTDQDFAHWRGTVDAKLDAIVNNSTQTLARLNDHSERIQALEKFRAVVLSLLWPFQLVFGAIVAYLTKKFGG